MGKKAQQSQFHEDDGKFARGNKAALGNRYTLPYIPRPTARKEWKNYALEIVEAVKKRNPDYAVNRLMNIKDDATFSAIWIKLVEEAHKAQNEELKRELEMLKFMRESGENQNENKNTIEISFSEEENDEEE